MESKDRNFSKVPNLLSRYASRPFYHQRSNKSRRHTGHCLFNAFYPIPRYCPTCLLSTVQGSAWLFQQRCGQVFKCCELWQIIIAQSDTNSWSETAQIVYDHQSGCRRDGQVVYNYPRCSWSGGQVQVLCNLFFAARASCFFGRAGVNYHLVCAQSESIGPGATISALELQKTGAFISHNILCLVLGFCNFWLKYIICPFFCIAANWSCQTRLKAQSELTHLWEDVSWFCPFSPVVQEWCFVDVHSAHQYFFVHNCACMCQQVDRLQPPINTDNLVITSAE